MFFPHRNTIFPPKTLFFPCLPRPQLKWRLVLPAAGHLAGAQLEVAGREAFWARPHEDLSLSLLIYTILSKILQWICVHVYIYTLSLRYLNGFVYIYILIYIYIYSVCVYVLLK